MCKCDYCQGALAPLYQISTNGSPSYALFEPDFCPKCGTPLGEVKPLTVEQLQQMDGKPVFVVDNNKNERLWCVITMYGDILVVEIAGRDEFWYEQKNYATTWLAYPREPKGEAE